MISPGNGKRAASYSDPNPTTTTQKLPEKHSQCTAVPLDHSRDDHLAGQSWITSSGALRRDLDSSGRRTR
jgi:hypothetical protein